MSVRPSGVAVNGPVTQYTCAMSVVTNTKQYLVAYDAFIVYIPEVVIYMMLVILR